MTAEFLSICIPTRNRGHLVRDLLASIVREIRVAGLTAADVRVHVFDNGSTDGTGEAVRAAIQGAEAYVEYTRHPQNIGAAGNQLLCARTGAGRYRWVIGDDEVLAEGALPYVLDILRREAPAWFIVADGGRYGRGLGLPRWFRDVREFVMVAKVSDPETLMTAGGWSMNIFRSDCFDHGLAQSHAGDSTYPHFFGMMKGLRDGGGRVFFTDRPTVLFREVRPPPPDNELPANSDLNWRRCLEWLRTEFEVPDLDPGVQSRLVSEQWMRDALRHPWRTFRNNARLFLIPGTWVRVFKRLWYFARR